MLGERGLVDWPRPEQPEAAEVTMEEASDLKLLSPGETVASQRNGTVKWATELADTVRTQMRTTPETDASQ